MPCWERKKLTLANDAASDYFGCQIRALPLARA
jgi:hypothetical protein